MNAEWHTGIAAWADHVSWGYTRRERAFVDDSGRKHMEHCDRSMEGWFLLPDDPMPGWRDAEPKDISATVPALTGRVIYTERRPWPDEVAQARRDRVVAGWLEAYDHGYRWRMAWTATGPIVVDPEMAGMELWDMEGLPA